ncbi:MAG: glycerol-3-phosphate dehydrogenase/oxidase [Ktedonobacteraceae bacterium]
MHQFSAAARPQNLARLQDEPFDVLVIGGGVTGAGVALDAAARGYTVALVEKLDFASGTSSKSTKLVHGGIRYLPNFDFALVREALIERGLLLHNAPFLVQPIGFVLPIYEGERHPVGMRFTTPGGVGLGLMLDFGLWLYDRLAGKRNIAHHRRLSRKQVLELAPGLAQEGLKEGFIYYDAQTNDARLTLTLLRTAAQLGAVIANYSEVQAFLSENGRVSGVQLCDHLGQQELTVRARHIVNATGIYSERVESLVEKEPQVRIEPSKGVHLVFAREKLRVGEDAIVLPETDDKRILFLVPWESRVIFGTTDTGSGDLDHPVATREDIHYLLKHLKRYLTVDLNEKDILSVYAGYRPLVLPHKASHSSAQLSRTHAVLQSPSGLVSIVGGKLTTYRRMAQDTVDLLQRRDTHKIQHPTTNLPLLGSAGWSEAQSELARRGNVPGLDERVIDHLGSIYGTEMRAIFRLIEEDPTLAERLIADLPYIRAQVVHACRAEMAMTPYDLLARRTSIILEDRQRGLDIVEGVADLMTRELHWSPEQRTRLVEEYRSAVQGQVETEQA